MTATAEIDEFFQDYRKKIGIEKPVRIELITSGGYPSERFLLINHDNQDERGRIKVPNYHSNERGIKNKLQIQGTTLSSKEIIEKLKR